MSKQICRCKICKKTPEELAEYKLLAEDEGYASAEEAVIHGEGTYNPNTKQFYCTECYIKIGCPLGTA